MTATPVPFYYEGREVRTLDINGDPWFVAADVCAALGLANPTMAIANLDEDEKGVNTVETPGGPQQMLVINEPGLYSLVLRSRKPEAKAFKRWVTHEVLPTIRKTGTYSVDRRPKSQLDILAAAVAELQRIEQEVTANTAAVREIEHRVDALEGNHGWYSALAYAKRQGWPTSVEFLNPLGRRAGQIGRAAGLKAAKVPHPIFGEANAWPEWVWDTAYQDGAGE